MKRFFQKKIILPVIASGFLFIAVSFQNDFFEIAKQIEIFTTTFKTVNQNYVDKTNPGQLMDIALKNMLKELDPYTVFFNEQDVLKFKINYSGEYTGIGASIERKDGIIILKEIFKNFPADKAGLKPGDRITKIGEINLKEYTEDTSQLLKGAKNAKVTIEFERNGKKQNATLILDEVEVKSVPFYTLLEDKSGYIVLTKFMETSTKEVKEAVIKLKEQGATKIILDLRDNPGGLLHEAVNICNLFVPKNEIIVTTQSKIQKHNNIFKTQYEPLDLEIPLVVIINDRSASASEIVSGALQDLDRAVIIGNRSFGKGLVQRPINLPYGTQVKVTISRYYIPSGRCIQALDYAQKDDKGKALKNQKFNEFKTKGGRKVYDGGGVLPDVENKAANLNFLTKSLLTNNAVFDFASQIYYANAAATKTPQVTQADFTAFLSFIQKDAYKIETETNALFGQMKEKAITENVESTIATELKNLENAIAKSYVVEITKNKTEIINLIQEELITRYEYKEGLYNYWVKNDSDISKAKTILNTPAEYKGILKK